MTASRPWFAACALPSAESGTTSFNAAWFGAPKSPLRTANPTLSASSVEKVSHCPTVSAVNTAARNRPTSAPTTISSTRLCRSASTPPISDETTLTASPTPPMMPARPGSSVTMSASSGTTKPTSALVSSNAVSLTSHSG